MALALLFGLATLRFGTHWLSWSLWLWFCLSPSRHATTFCAHWNLPSLGMLINVRSSSASSSPLRTQSSRSIIYCYSHSLFCNRSTLITVSCMPDPCAYSLSVRCMDLYSLLSVAVTGCTSVSVSFMVCSFVQYRVYADTHMSFLGLRQSVSSHSINALRCGLSYTC